MGLIIPIKYVSIRCEQRPNTCSRVISMRHEKPWVLEVDRTGSRHVKDHYERKEFYYCCSKRCCEKLKEWFCRDSHYATAIFDIREGWSPYEKN